MGIHMPPMGAPRLVDSASRQDWVPGRSFLPGGPPRPLLRAECVGGLSRAFKSPQGSAPSLDGVGGYLAMTGTPWELKLEGFCCHAVQSLTLWILPVNDRLATANLAGQLS